MFLLLALVYSCGPKPREGADLPIPYDLNIETKNRRAVIYWSVDRSKDKPISGYNIYLSDKPLEKHFSKWEKNRPKPYNHAPFPGDTDGDVTRESFEITNLENGKTYYISVRTVGITGAESGVLKEVEFVPQPRGEFMISSNHSSKNGGFSFDEDISVPARDPRCDIYLYAKRDVVGLSTPGRLSAGLRKTAFTKRNEKNVETVKIKAGDRLTVETRYGRAEISVKSIDHIDLEASAVIEYIFYPAGYDK